MSERLTDEQRAELTLSEWLADFDDRTEVGDVARVVLPMLKELASLRQLLATPMPGNASVYTYDDIERGRMFGIEHGAQDLHGAADKMLPLGAALIRAALAARGGE